MGHPIRHTTWHTMRHTTWHTTWHTSWHTITRHATTRCSTLLVQLGDDRVADGLHLLLLFLELVHLGQLVAVQPFHSILTFADDRFLLVFGDLIFQLLIVHGWLHIEAIRFEAVLGCDSLLLLFILSLELVRIVHHPLNLLLRQATLVIGDGDIALLVGGLVHSRHVENPVGIDVKGDLNLRNSTRSWWDSSEVKLAKKVVIPCHGSLPLKHLDRDGRLVVRVGREGLSLLGGNRCVPLDKWGHHTSCCLDTHREWSNIEKQKVRDCF